MNDATNAAQPSMIPSDARPILPNADGRFSWGNGLVSMVFEAPEDGPVHMLGMAGRGMEPVTVDIVGERDAQPIVDLRSSSNLTANAYNLAESTLGMNLRFDSAYAYDPDTFGHIDQYRLAIMQRSVGPDEIVVVSIFDVFEHVSAVRCFTVVSSARPYPVEAVSSFAVTLPFMHANIRPEDADVYWGESATGMEQQWRHEAVADTVLRGSGSERVYTEALNGPICFTQCSTSTWSTAKREPCGIIDAHGTGAPDERPFSVMWQVEHNGAWKWRIREFDTSLSVDAFGPEYTDHQWFTMLGEHNDCVTVSATFAICAGGWQQVVAEMTMKRRAMKSIKAYELGRSEQEREARTLVMYSDFRDTLRGDPTIERELPLVESAHQAGADVFCIGPGWFDNYHTPAAKEREHGDMDRYRADESEHACEREVSRAVSCWWDSVGDWYPAPDRFGTVRFAGLVHDIQAHGMQVGLWIEPESVALRSRAAKELPEHAFMHRHGMRIASAGRYLLDFRAPETYDFMTSTIRQLIREFDIRYFIFDSTVTPGAGSDEDAESVGGALLAHCRAFQDWIDDIRKEFPNVTIENSAVGGARADYIMLMRLDLQCVTLQEDPVEAAVIAASTGVGVIPEQQAMGAVVQPCMDHEQAVFALASAMLGRMLCSGRINELEPAQMALVQEAIATHRDILEHMRHMLPWWPAGLPDWNDDWLAYGLRHDLGISDDRWPSVAKRMRANDYEDYLVVWRRGGAASFDVPLHEPASLHQIFPAVPEGEENDWTVARLDEATVRLSVPGVDGPAARVFAVRHQNR